MWYRSYSQRIALKLSSFSLSHSQRIFMLPHTNPFGSGFWLKDPHTEFSLSHSAGLIWVPKPFSPLWLCYWSTDPHCLASSICHFTPTVLWQAQPGQIGEQKSGVPEPQRKKNENQSDAPCRVTARKKKGRKCWNKISFCKLSEIGFFAGNTLWQRSIESFSISDCKKKKRKRQKNASRKVKQSKWAYLSFLFLPHLHIQSIMYNYFIQTEQKKSFESHKVHFLWLSSNCGSFPNIFYCILLLL